MQCIAVSLKGRERKSKEGSDSAAFAAVLRPGSMGRRNKVKTMKAAGAGIPGAVDIPAAAVVVQVKNEVDEENDAVMMAAAESPMIVPSSDDVTLDTMDGEEELVGSDQTSADYYFDSYAHFGKRVHSLHLLIVFSSRRCGSGCLLRELSNSVQDMRVLDDTAACLGMEKRCEVYSRHSFT